MKLNKKKLTANSKSIFRFLKFIFFLFLPILVILVITFGTIQRQRFEDERRISVFANEIKKETGINFKVKYINFTGVYNYELKMPEDAYTDDDYFDTVCDIFNKIYTKVLYKGDTELSKNGYRIRIFKLSHNIDFEYDVYHDKIKLTTNMFCDYSKFKIFDNNEIKLVVFARKFTEEQIKSIIDDENYSELNINVITD